jgi:hypothetical protein
MNDGDRRIFHVETRPDSCQAQKARGENAANGQQHDAEDYLQQDKPAAQVPTAQGERRFAAFHGETEIRLRDADRRGQPGQKENS